MSIQEVIQLSDTIDDFANLLNEKTIEASNMVLKTLILIHGGAAVTLLAFIGNLSGNSAPGVSNKIVSLAKTLVWFGWGMVIAIVAMIFAYFTHYLTVGHAYSTTAKQAKCYAIGKAIFHVLAALAALVSLVAFLCGMYQVRDAILEVLR